MISVIEKERVPITNDVFLNYNLGYYAKFVRTTLNLVEVYPTIKLVF